MDPSSVSNSDLWHQAFPIVDAFDEQLHQTGIGNAQLVLAAFLVTFLIVRTITHMIKAGKGPFGNISVGGTHLHHLVPGIFLLLKNFVSSHHEYWMLWVGIVFILCVMFMREGVWGLIVKKGPAWLRRQ